MGHFVGYDSESKGYRIYWPGKRSVTVERNVVFNENDIQTLDEHAIIPGDTLTEGERDKIIQAPSHNAENSTKTVNTENSEKPDIQTVIKPQSEEQTVLNLQEPQSSNSVPFPPISKPATETKDDEEEPQMYGCGHRVEPKPKGVYKKMHAGIFAGIADHENQPLDDENSLIKSNNDDERTFADLLPDLALIGGPTSDPHSLDKALRGPDAKEWQAALQYEISQLEKLGTWVVEDLPKGYTATPCSEVLKVK